MGYDVTGNDAPVYDRLSDGVLTRVWEVTETEVSGTTEFDLSPVPRSGHIYYYQWELSSVGIGTATTVRPQFRRATGAWGSDIDDIKRVDTSAATGSITTTQPFYSDAGSLFIRAVADAGSDNTVKHLIVIVSGSK